MKRIILILFITTLFFSCSSNDEPETLQENFYALTVGNSWVYKNYKYNPTTEKYDYTGVIDSISIISTEDIFDITYFKFRRFTTGNEDNITLCNANGEHFEYLREFEGNLIRDDGAVKFTNSNFEERELMDAGSFIIYEKLIEGTQEIITEAGIFECINSERYARNEQGEQYPGLDRFYYSDGVGLIYDTSSFVSQDIPSIIRRLDSYDIQ